MIRSLKPLPSFKNSENGSDLKYKSLYLEGATIMNLRQWKFTAGIMAVTLLIITQFFITDGLQTDGRSITQGLANTVLENNLLDCMGGRVSAVGEISSTDGQNWIVPANTEFGKLEAPDLFNECNNARPANINAVNLNDLPVVEVDANGETLTAYIFADNYFELYINGQLIGTDPVPFTPFNSNVIRFQASYPMTIAVKLVDWEENLGLGSENNRGNDFHAGDGGFIATFEDGNGNVVATTGSDWKAQTFYIAPLDDPNHVVTLSDNTRSSESASTSPTCNANCFAVHYATPEDWASSDFDDTVWPNATTYTEDEIGVNNKPSYANFVEKFSGSGATFIWSSNVVLDNEVLVRFTLNQP
jgi:hypothetical protein